MAEGFYFLFLISIIVRYQLNNVKQQGINLLLTELRRCTLQFKIFHAAERISVILEHYRDRNNVNSIIP